MKPLVKGVLAVAFAVLLVRIVEGQFGRGGRERRNRVPEPSAVLRTLKSLRCSFSGGPDIELNGALGVVTVFAKETRDGRLQAVYSHTSYFENGSAPDVGQYQGDCEAGR